MLAQTYTKIERHPCISKEAAHKYGRIHLPVAPRCNIKCRYCVRKFDCANESKPGVSSMVLKPEEAIERIRWYREKFDYLSVAAVAGPGEPLVNQQTFTTLRLVKEEFPDLLLCLSTNGLLLPERMEEIISLGVGTLTVTVNAIDPEIGAKIYSYVNYDGKTHIGLEAAKILLKNQIEGIKMAVEAGIIAKINTVYMPDINGEHLTDIAKFIKGLGIYLMNVIPLIPQSECANFRPPTEEELQKTRQKLKEIIPQMMHCKQCRADACGKI